MRRRVRSVPPWVSILTPSADAVENVALQEYPRLDSILLSGTSPEDMVDGLERARGELIVHLGPGETLLPNAVAKLVSALTIPPGVVVAYPAFRALDSRGTTIETVVPEELEFLEMLRFQLWPAGPAPMFRRDLGLRAARSETSGSRFGELGFWMKIASQGRVRRLAEPLACRQDDIAETRRPGGVRAARELLGNFERAVAELELPPGSERALASAARSACVLAATEIGSGFNGPRERFFVADRFSGENPEEPADDLDREIGLLMDRIIQLEQRLARQCATIPVLEDAVVAREARLAGREGGGWRRFAGRGVNGS